MHFSNHEKFTSKIGEFWKKKNYFWSNLGKERTGNRKEENDNSIDGKL